MLLYKLDGIGRKHVHRKRYSFLNKRKILIWITCSLSFLGAQGQDSEGEEEAPQGSFEWGITAGVQFPGDSSASFYNGKAPDDRIKSLLQWQSVRREVRKELGNDYEFLSYTPAHKMSYNTAYSVGLNAQYFPKGSEQHSVQTELLYSRLKTEHFFYLLVDDPNKAVDDKRAFPVSGEEDRFLFSLNYHREGTGDPFRVFGRVGANIGYAEASRNRISIGGLQYSVLPSSDPRYGDPEIQKGMILGGQGELGLQFQTAQAWDLSLSGRLLYSKVAIGKDAAFEPHGGIYFRVIHTGN